MSEITGETSDGYHTFNELYEHRIALFLFIVKSLPDRSWWSRKNSDGSEWKGWIVVGYKLPNGQEITYHMEEKYIQYLGGVVKELDKGRWDGHTSKEVVERILKLL